MGYFLGQEAATLTYSRATKTLNWTSSAAAVEVYVNGTLFLEGAPSGRAVLPSNWSPPPYHFELKDALSGEPLTWVDVAADGTVTGPVIYGGEISPPPGGPPPSRSWFEQSTSLLGMAIPNLLLAAGGGLLVLAAVIKRKG